MSSLPSPSSICDEALAIFHDASYIHVADGVEDAVDDVAVQAKPIFEKKITVSRRTPYKLHKDVVELSNVVETMSLNVRFDDQDVLVLPAELEYSFLFLYAVRKSSYHVESVPPFSTSPAPSPPRPPPYRLKTVLKYNEIQGRAFTVEGSVTEIHNTSGWYYNACLKCPKAANESGPEWACASDGRFPTPRPAYRVQATITDSIGVMKVTFFNEGAESLVGRPCSKLVIESGYKDQSIVPDLLQEAKGKPKAFHLEMQTNTRPGRLNMTVTAVAEIDITLPLSIEAALLSIDAAPTLPLKLEEAAPPQPRSSSIAPITSVKIESEPRTAEKDDPKR
ncbi:hypothetical protein SSX86_007505 [Deinandra increscens subsp. villosa]|uniref:Replication factor A C-terminal domain-containing protein n=1 Tax=Deinandra increscens subsp. villosa TaxID=3103831 RepID=A0AAP0DDL7_9ASTR